MSKHTVNTPLKAKVVLGGVNILMQAKSLRGGADILYESFPDVMDAVRQKKIDLSRIEILVLDDQTGVGHGIYP